MSETNAMTALYEAFEEERLGYNNENMEQLGAGATKVLTLFVKRQELFDWELYKYLTTLYLIGSSFMERAAGSFKDPKIERAYYRINRSRPDKKLTPLLPLVGAILFVMLGLFLFRSPWAGENMKTVMKIIVWEIAALGAFLGWGFSYLEGNPHWGAGVTGAIFGYAAGIMVVDFNGEAVLGKLPMVLVGEAGLIAIILLILTFYLLRERAEYHKECKVWRQYLREHKEECEALRTTLRERSSELKEVLQWTKSGKRWDEYDTAISMLSENITYKKCYTDAAGREREDKKNYTVEEIKAGIKDSAFILEGMIEHFEEMEKALAKRYANV